MKKSKDTKDIKKKSYQEAYEINEAEHNNAVRLLRLFDWEKCKNVSRQNVIRKGEPGIKTPKTSTGKEYCHSFIFGKNMKDSEGKLSYWSTEYEELYEAFRSLIDRIHPEHYYTNITVNKNLNCKRHTDGGNDGISYIISFGEFTGGRLFIEPPGGGKPKAVDIYRRFVAFNGSTQPHETEKFVGERYSAVFYTSAIVPTETAPRKRYISNISDNIDSTTTVDDSTINDDAVCSKKKKINDESLSVKSLNSNSSSSNKQHVGDNSGKEATAVSNDLQQRFSALKKKLQNKVK